RIPASTCASPFMPGVNPATFGTDFAAFGAAIGNATNSAQKLPAEPPLKCYVTNGCPASAAAPRVRLTLAPRRVTAGRRTRVVARGTLVFAGGRTAPARGGIVRLGGLRKTLDAHGRTTLRLTLHRAGRRRATLGVPTVGAASASLRV